VEFAEWDEVGEAGEAGGGFVERTEEEEVMRHVGTDATNLDYCSRSVEKKLEERPVCPQDVPVLTLRLANGCLPGLGATHRFSSGELR